MTAPGTTPGSGTGLADLPPRLSPPPEQHTSGQFRIKVSAYRSALDATPRTIETDFQGFVKSLTTFRDGNGIDDKRKLSAWSPATLKPGARRANDNVVEVSAIVLDYDSGDTSIAEALTPWSSWPAIVHTSWSNAEESPKFRIVVPLARPVPAAAWRWVWVWASTLAAGTIDRACKDASRLYFLPYRRDGRPAFAALHDPGGWLCDPDWHRASPADWERAGRPERVLTEAQRARLTERPISEAAARRVARDALRNDPSLRARLASDLGARTTSERAFGITCPRCRRESVWFALHPAQWGGAACNHRNSCGWSGFIDELGGK